MAVGEAPDITGKQLVQLFHHPRLADYPVATDTESVNSAFLID
jgi:hypothetical protein